MPADSYIIRARYLLDGSWRSEDCPSEGSFAKTGEEASRIATYLDKRFGSDHFWTVDVYNRNGKYGSYYQLFHGRLS